MSGRSDDDALSDPDEARGVGAATGVGGLPLGFAWLNRSRTRTAVDGVPPATVPGFVRALVGFAVFLSVAVVGRSLVPALGLGWAVVALAAVFVVMTVWPRPDIG